MTLQQRACYYSDNRQNTNTCILQVKVSDKTLCLVLYKEFLKMQVCFAAALSSKEFTNMLTGMFFPSRLCNRRLFKLA